MKTGPENSVEPIFFRDTVSTSIQSNEGKPVQQLAGQLLLLLALPLLLLYVLEKKSFAIELKSSFIF